MVSVLYSFPWRIGDSGVGYTAFSHVDELAKLDLELRLISGAIRGSFACDFEKRTTMSLGNKKVPAKAFGGMDNAARFHDFCVSRYVRRNYRDIDVLHCWPGASELSIKAAKKHGIRTFLERPNAHTRFACDVVRDVYRDLGIKQSKKSSHVVRDRRLAREELEYELTDFLLCPSRFVAETFFEAGYPREKVLQHQYGYSPVRIKQGERRDSTFRLLFVGNDALRKGLHNILEAWKRSDAIQDGELHILGRVDQEVLEFLGDSMNLDGVEFHGFTSNVAEHFSKGDVLVLSSYEEGSALVTYEARAAGCVLLVSNSTGAVVDHGHNGLIHSPGDVETLVKHINLVYSDRSFLGRLRENSLKDIETLTWSASAKRLARIYSENI